MPLYEFKCTDCDSRFETLVRESWKTEGVKCPSCDSPKVTRLFSLFSGGAGSSEDFRSDGACNPGSFTSTV